MVNKNRKAYISPTCLSTNPYPEKVVFAQNSNRGHIYDVEGYDDAPAKSLVNVQCFPLISYLEALNVTTVDYFSLDVEGAEYKVLQTIPWDKVDIKTLSVEYLHDAEGKEAIRTLLLSNGYSVYTEVSAAYNLANDFIFVKDGLLESEASR
ncbi:Methyltransferase FkbM [Trinorchestia longiramus]|nr:Methyltransferase FkbM [Trinorchestia longiramus]